MDRFAMNKKDRKHHTDDIPFLRDLASFYKHIKARPPLNKDFDIREIDPEVLKGYDYTAKPFHHSFYCITFLLEGDVTLNSGFWKQSLKKPALYFKTPFQLVSWVKPERWLKEYFIVFTEDFITRNWERVTRCRKPVIAAVAGYALGGGCELAMMCDFILAADNARFGQPEINLGVVPGAGGTQRLTRFVGKSKAMEMVLTGRIIDAVEAERCGLVARVVPLSELIDEALAVAGKIAELSAPVVGMAREAVNRALETPLAEGLIHERLLFEATFELDDRREGMSAFIDKRRPSFRHR